jgi:hypothetical protein
VLVLPWFTWVQKRSRCEQTRHMEPTVDGGECFLRGASAEHQEATTFQAQAHSGRTARPFSVSVRTL